MSWNEFIEERTGYKPMTTFWDDFSIAEMFGLDAVIGTFNMAFKEWHNNVFTEETNQHPFTVIVGSFRCEASPAAIFYLIYKFELLNNIKPKDRKVFKFNQ